MTPEDASPSPEALAAGSPLIWSAARREADREARQIAAAVLRLIRDFEYESPMVAAFRTNLSLGNYGSLAEGLALLALALAQENAQLRQRLGDILLRQVPEFDEKLDRLFRERPPVQ